MKKIIINSIILFSLAIVGFGCKKQNYPGGEVSPYLPIFDLRGLYKGDDITLNTDNMYGSSSISAVVISDHSGKNLPAGLLIVQDKKRLSQLRGIAIPIGSDADKYVPGDSVVINVSGGVLSRVDGILQIKGIAPSAVIRVAQNKPIAKNRVPSSFILADPNKYESTLLAIVKGGFDPLPSPTDVLSGDKILNDGFADITLHTEATATFAKNLLQFSANYYGILFNKVSSTGSLIPQHRLRTANDIITLSSTPEIPDFIISGWIVDPKGTNANNNYIQFIATRDINFATTPFSVVTTNNAGASLPTGFPSNGWATGGLRTYKFNLTSGSIKKGEYFYVGGTGRMINSTSSTPIPTAQYIRAINYSTTAGDGFGSITSTLLANSGNAYGIAAFKGTTVTVSTKPIDVVFVSNGGSLFSPGPPAQGYRIANNDFYDVYDPLEVDPADPNKGFQPFYLQGTNTLRFNYHPGAGGTGTAIDLGYFYKAGGIYSVTLGKWIKARSVKHFILSKVPPVATMATIEDDNVVINTNAAGVEIGRDTIPPTRIK
ncbi:hypothetical protein EZ449_20200 [Pedobacter frigidisoli]|uniref:DUF5689 domain-containing protein n=1 Tax=Pedobacter frigidisoli TaxID=2530455 RepID=A0A4V2ML54_9SPHI|nr:DUF5689 domain-containing protein [Pedobacter frigidisoli]TCD00687.1 hypothetical protein EZ449_20200 [Pedobacter frigidisoli]